MATSVNRIDCGANHWKMMSKAAASTHGNDATKGKLTRQQTRRPLIERAGLGWAGTTIFPKVKSNDSGVDAHLVSDVSLPLRGFHVASFNTARDWLLLLRLRLLLKFPFVCMYVYTRPTSSKSHRQTSWSLGLPVTLLICRR